MFDGLWLINHGTSVPFWIYLVSTTDWLSGSSERGAQCVDGVGTAPARTDHR